MRRAIPATIFAVLIGWGWAQPPLKIDKTEVNVDNTELTIEGKNFGTSGPIVGAGHTEL